MPSRTRGAPSRYVRLRWCHLKMCHPWRSSVFAGALTGKHMLLVGVTGFIGKVWMVDLLEQIPDIGKITLLIRRNRTTTAQRRFEKIVEESPTLDGLQKRYGARLGDFLRAKIEVVEGDVSQPGLGLEESVGLRLSRSLDLVVNSAGLTDFNPDLRDAVSSNVESTEHLLNFIRGTDHAALMHLSTCYVVGMRDGRVTETLQDNYNPASVKNFDCEREIASLREMIRHIEERSESPELARALRRQALGRGADETRVAAGELDGVLKRNRSRWVRNKLTRVGMRRAQYLGWPNTYTFTKSLGESLLARRGKDLPIAVVRPSIVESSHAQPVQRLERRHQYFRPALLFAGHQFPPTAFQREKMPRRDSGGHGLPRHDADCRRTDRTQKRPPVPTRDFRHQPLRHGPQHRTHRTGASQALSHPAGNRALAQTEI